MARRVSSLALTTLMGLKWIIKIKHTNYKQLKDLAAVKLVPKPHEVNQCYFKFDKHVCFYDGGLLKKDCLNSTFFKFLQLYDYMTIIMIVIQG